MRHAAYQSGNLEPDALVTTMGLNLLSSNLSQIDATMLAHFLETWCEHHCVGAWRVEHDYKKLQISMSLDRDLVLFKISEEYDIMLRHTL